MAPQRTRVLAVDDNRVILRIIKDGLEKEGFEVRTAGSGMEALEQILQEKPDVILLDIVMPGVTGYEVCKILRHDPHTEAIPIIMVTGSTPDKVKKEGMEAGASDIWAKPVNMREIARSIHSFLEQGFKLEQVTPARENEVLRENLQMIAAEFRNPIQALGTIAEMLEESARIEPRQVAEVIRQQVERASDLLRRMERLVA
ncbi:MAG: hybrid sensor histidine kinase/response regulator [Candidatus Riflebacteria bacterium]|nr:hybrid sensor histidine kinase/response regulator [Candidatus Riflebacteria bacterium]